MTYEELKKLGASLETLRVSYRYWTADFAIAPTATDPGVVGKACYGWFRDMVDDAIGEVNVTQVKDPAGEPPEWDDYAWLGLAPEPAPEPEEEALPFTEDGAHTEDDTKTFEVAEYSLEQLEDGRFKLELWPRLGDGKVGKYSEIKFTADRERMGAMLENLDGVKCPSKGSVKWFATWQHGRFMSDGKRRYRDLISIEP